MAGRLIGPWNPALDASGKPINGSKLNTYMAGTTTNLATYPTAADADAGTNANTNPVVADSAGRFGELWAPNGGSYDLKWTDASGVQIKLFSNVGALGVQTPGAVQRGHLAGLGLSTAGSSANMTIAAGEAADSTHTVLMTLSASITKTTGAWAVGTNQGGLDTGAIANSTWYHFFEIERPDTGVVDVAFSTSASAPTTGGNIPAAYSLSRYIGSGKTDGSGHWTAFRQSGDLFEWTAPVTDVNGDTTFTSAPATKTLTVPTGISVSAFGTCEMSAGSGGSNTFNIYSPNLSAQASGGGLCQLASAASGLAASRFDVTTNTSGQVMIVAGAGGSTLWVVTRGWTDRRGRDD